MSIILIPAYKPSETLVSLVRELSETFTGKIVVVDDGSGEAYRSTFAAIAAYSHIITKPLNAGKGAAIKTALGYIYENYDVAETVVTCDADGQHRVSDIINVAQSVQKSPHSLVLGTRVFGKGTPIKSLLGNTITRAVFFFAAHRNVPDTQTGLRGFGVAQIPWLLTIPGDRYEYEINMLLYAARRKMKQVFVPIETVYIDGNSSSHFHAFRDSAIIYGHILKFSLSSILSFCIDFILLLALKVLFSGLGESLSLLLAVIFARAGSSFVNYTLNRSFVFERGSNTSIVKYYALVVCVLTANYAMLSLLNTVLSFPLFWAKTITEILLFFVSYTIQQHIVFKQKEESHE
ncbi:MAG: bifunctional glycosyltransferase family 2/GtrA family protein [Clostridia bacterium]|nr:bifunctional glycosyltransferase family 2/GtrA family protein [Clostridia bacterium]